MRTSAQKGNISWSLCGVIELHSCFQWLCVRLTAKTMSYDDVEDEKHLTLVFYRIPARPMLGLARPASLQLKNIQSSRNMSIKTKIMTSIPTWSQCFCMDRHNRHHEGPDIYGHFSRSLTTKSSGDSPAWNQLRDHRKRLETVRTREKKRGRLGKSWRTISRELGDSLKELLKRETSEEPL